MLSPNLQSASLTGQSVTNAGYTRNWLNVRPTGVIRESKHGGQLIEVETPKGIRSINLSRFTGAIKASDQTLSYSGGRAVKSPTAKIRKVIADVVLGKGHNVRVANARF